MLSLVTSQTQFLDVSGSGDADTDSLHFELLKEELRSMKSKVKAKFKEREMFPLVRDMWFYSENQTTGDVQLQFRGKGMLSRTHWPAEMNTVTVVTYRQLRHSLGVGIDEVIVDECHVCTYDIIVNVVCVCGVRMWCAYVVCM